MSVIELRFYDGDDPNGSLLGTLTDAHLSAAKIRKALRGVGGGEFSIPRSHPSASASLIRKGNYVRVVIPTISADPVWAFWLWEGQFNLLDGNGDDTLTFSGPGPLGILRDAILHYTPYAPAQPARGSADHDDVWWWINEPYGAILTRVIEEGQNEPGLPLDPVTIDFDRTTDSASVAWPNIDGEYQQPIQANVLTVFEDLRDAGDMFVFANPDLLVQAYQTFGTNRSSATFAAGKVRLTDTNILTGLSRHIHATNEATHLLGRSMEGDYYTEIHPSYTTGRARWISLDAPETNDDALLSKLGQEALLGSTRDTDAFEAEHTPGDDEATGRYLPWLHYDVGDTITVDAGTGPYAYVDADARVVAFRVELAAASDDSTTDLAQRSLHTVIELNAGTSEGAPTDGRGVGSPGCRCLRLCNALTPGTETVTRLYLTNDAAPGTPPPIDAGWEADEATTPYALATSLSASVDGGNDQTEGDVNDDICLYKGTFLISSGMATGLAAGGATVVAHLRTRARHGVGVSEAAQNHISQIGLRVTQGNSLTIRGTALALHGLTSSAGATKWPADTPYVNTLFPPATATNVLSAVSGTAAGDYLVAEFGYRSLNSAATAHGGGIWVNDSAASDLPEDEATSTDLNSWVEVRYISSPAGAGLNPDLVGTDHSATRCDHKHHVLSDRDPTTTDDITQGYPTTTQWTNTETLRTFLLVDEDTGEWVLIADPDHTHDWTDITGTPDTVSTVVDHGSMGATETFTFTDGSDHEGTLTADLTVTLAGATADEAAFMTLVLSQDGTGGWDITWPGSVEWPGGVAPTFDTTANAVSIVNLFTYDGGTIWYGFLAGGSASGLLVREVGGSDIDTTELEFDADDFVVTDQTGGVARVELATASLTAAAVAALGFVGPILMTDGIVDPPEPLWTDDGTDYLYADL